MTSKSFEFRVYDDSLREPLERFIARVWPREDAEARQGEQPDAASDQRPGADGASARPPTFLFLRDNEVIAHISTLPVQLALRSRRIPAHWVVGFMVLPEYRNGPIGPLLIKSLKDELDLGMSLHVETTVLKIFKGFGWKHVGLVPQYIRVLNSGTFLENIRLDTIGLFQRRGLSGIASLPLTRFLMSSSLKIMFGCLTLGTWAKRPRARGDTREEEQFDASFDALWRRVQSSFEASVVRDRDYLTSRFGNKPKQYRLLVCRDGDELLGYCVLKIKQFTDDPRMGNVKIGSIVDCLFDFDSPEDLQALVSAAMKTFREERVDVAFCTASHFQVRELLTCNGFIEIPGNLNFVYHDRNGSTDSGPAMGSWHLMRSDSDADANF